MRKVPALIATAGLVLATLTACSPATGTADCESPVSAGKASELVSVTGDFDSAPTIDFPTPLKTETTQRSELIEGTGPGLVEGQVVQIELSVFDATTGDPIKESAYDDTSKVTYIVGNQMPDGLTDGLLCAQVGSRSAVVTAPGVDNTGIDSDDSVVFVIDVIKSYKTRADGADQLPVAGLPAVVLTDDGTPGITVPSAEPPTDLKIGVLKKGDGEEVTDGSTVIVNYTGVLWKEKTVFDSSWTAGQPAAIVVDRTTADQPLPGLAQALVGQTVGSQIIAVIPPELAYGDQASGEIPADSTLVFVFDILGVE
ncbi:FKBP-type peptidyl-prolyl cis-trans isomerase [Cryobacterium sp. SO2]|uniref:FKBP-type peptidyl-prolyl cis-trans isomerase n=1 Tax=Cryobacterium sp. SO2 TaxID=1897060 RepID=UPI00223DF971|nr:FKBP-type peptidyl-prolyl cis-trans isomerase [Cryobacterium sp. SO2]WEO79192.1 FKBP-type peptidyl-prolyl cis-trans isomerase [Cryobacterium sp. SO2]